MKKSFILLAVIIVATQAFSGFAFAQNMANKENTIGSTVDSIATKRALVLLRDVYASYISCCKNYNNCLKKIQTEDSVNQIPIYIKQFMDSVKMLNIIIGEYIHVLNKTGILLKTTFKDKGLTLSTQEAEDLINKNKEVIKKISIFIKDPNPQNEQSWLNGFVSSNNLALKFTED